MKQVPIYLFTGFLEAGKTRFIEETLGDPKFFEGKDKTLVILCEQGEEELNPLDFASKDVYIEYINGESELTAGNLSTLLKKHRATRVLLEYNGMWLLNTVFQNLPEGWVVCQEMMFADSETFEIFNSNMRNLTVDKLTSCELIVFNRCTPDTDRQRLHKIVRGVSRRTDIIYENADGSFEYDEIPDPLPFDINAAVINISDSDYALWYRDLSENMPQYDGKTVVFTGLVTKNDKLSADSFVIGRPIMTCCADDITYSGLLCEHKHSGSVERGRWIRLTASIDVKFSKLYNKRGPVLRAISIENIEPLAQPVATFY